MAGPNWSDDDPGDRPRIGANCQALLVELVGAPRAPLSLDDLRGWHRRVYEGCRLPAPAYLGNVRGDPAHGALADYEVGLGSLMGDGYPEKVGVWAADVASALVDYFAALDEAFHAADALVADRPRTVDELHQIVALAAFAHGEWVRMHPFANGNGRTARLVAAHVALRYGLPVFVRLTRRPGDVAYTRAAQASMGRPPDFVGDHVPSIGVFSHLLALAMLA